MIDDRKGRREALVCLGSLDQHDLLGHEKPESRERDRGQDREATAKPNIFGRIRTSSDRCIVEGEKTLKSVVISCGVVRDVGDSMSSVNQG